MLFDQTLKAGLLGESEIAKWLIGRGATVIPAYEIEPKPDEEMKKGPRVFRATGQLVTPDLLVINKDGGITWTEAKTKTGWTWYRNGQRWQDGVDRNHWGDYVRVDRELPWPVWVLFLHREANGAKDSPTGIAPPPPGLYGNRVTRLIDCIDHESDKHGRHGMVYWNRESLKHIAGYPLPAHTYKERE